MKKYKNFRFLQGLLGVHGVLYLLLVGGGALAKTKAKILPSPPAHCGADIAQEGYCAETSATGVFAGTVKITLFTVVDKADYPDADHAVERFVDFDLWTEHVLSTGRDEIVFDRSVAMPTTIDQMGRAIFRHYADFKIKTPIGYQSVRAVTHNYGVQAYFGALKSLEFQVQLEGNQEIPDGEKPLFGAEGVKEQFGSVHAASCINYDFCYDHELLLVYQATIKPTINLLPKVAANSILKATEVLLIGMFLPRWVDAQEYPDDDEDLGPSEGQGEPADPGAVDQSLISSQL